MIKFPSNYLLEEISNVKRDVKRRSDEGWRGLREEKLARQILP